MWFIAVSSVLIGLATGLEYQCENYGGMCTTLPCSRYYSPPTDRTKLCPGGQRCCVKDYCELYLKGVCMAGWYTCPGEKYKTRFGRTACKRLNDRCCVPTIGIPTRAPQTTTPLFQIRKTETCTTYNGVCQDHKTLICAGGDYHFVKDGKILCDKISERCCLKSSSAGTTTKPAGTTKSSSNTKQVCGVSKSRVGKRIVNGEEADRGEWPWQVSIIKGLARLGAVFTHTCGGTLISDKWVLSAAHCFRSLSSSWTVKVKVGEHSFIVEEGSESVVEVEEIYSHPQYVSNNNENDIALLKLKKPSDLSSKYVGLACMPDLSDIKDFYKTSECYSTGWGITHGTGDQRLLNEVRSPLIEWTECRKSWPRIGSTQVCFGDGVKQPCRGDSGGPLVCRKTVFDPFYLVGVVSYGSSSCRVASLPTVFTNVASYRNWISKTMKDNS